MAEKPILFSSEMIRAILEGRKKQTRRVMKPQPVFEYNYWLYDERIFRGEDDLQDYLFHNVYGSKGSPYGSMYSDGTSDTIWVRETWQAQNLSGQWWHEVPKQERGLHNWAVIDKADAHRETWLYGEPPKWIPSIFMPRWASRITLKITDVRIERVQQITRNDAQAEGVLCACCKGYHSRSCTCINQFENLWDKINAKRGYSWQSNPWVWVVGFEIDSGRPANKHLQGTPRATPLPLETNDEASPAEQAGWSDFYKGKDDNPYPKKSTAAQDWEIGWDRALRHENGEDY